MSKKKKGFDPFKAVVSHGALTVGTIGSIGIAGRVNTMMPSAPGTRIMGSMDTLKVVPTVHAASIGIGSLGMLGDVEKKARRRK